MDKRVSIVEYPDGVKVVVIHDATFKGRKKIDWDDIEKYLFRYVGEHFKILETDDKIYIGADFPDEYTSSDSRIKLKGARAKAKYGWYRFKTRFAIPMYADNGEIARYSVFLAELVIRHDIDKRKYLYDVNNIKKEKEMNMDYVMGACEYAD